MNPSQFKSELEADYIKIHNQLFPAGVKASKLRLNVVIQNEIETGIANLNSGYSSREDSITIVVTDADLRDDIRMRPCPITQFTPNWRRELLHETIHEFQYKCVLESNIEGVNLMNRTAHKFPGNGHGPDFYTAIILCSKKLGISEDELMELL